MKTDAETCAPVILSAPIVREESDHSTLMPCDHVMDATICESRFRPENLTIPKKIKKLQWERERMCYDEWNDFVDSDLIKQQIKATMSNF